MYMRFVYLAHLWFIYVFGAKTGSRNNKLPICAILVLVWLAE